MIKVMMFDKIIVLGCAGRNAVRQYSYIFFKETTNK